MDILHLDDQIVALNKPAGIAAVPGGWGKDAPSLVKMLEADYGKVWIVHRLDKVTSGVILFARTAAAHRTLSLLFETRAVHKAYRAIVCGVPGWDEYTARHRLLPDVGHKHRTVIDHVHGKSAVTQFRVLERIGSHAMLEATPETGRTHQVRAHVSALGFPLVADTLYGAPETDIISRPALHAISLEFELDGKAFSLAAPYPDDFTNALEKLRAGH